MNLYQRIIQELKALNAAPSAFQYAVDYAAEMEELEAGGSSMDEILLTILMGSAE